MSAPASRRGLMLGLAALPLAGGAVVATPAVTPKLARLIAKHDAMNDRLNAPADDGGCNSGLVRAAGALRARVAGFPSQGLPDILAKAACLGRMWPTEDLEVEVLEKLSCGYAYMDDMATALVAELIRFGEATLCA